MALKTHLEESEIAQLVEAAPTLRDRLIIQFLFRVGCRVSELINIKVDNIDWDRRMVLIPHLKTVALKKQCPTCNKKVGKRNKFCPYCGADISKVPIPEEQERVRIVRVDAETLGLAREYIDNRENGSDRLMPLTRQMVYCVVRQVAFALGLGGKILTHPGSGIKHYISPHKFRDAHALRWLERSRGDPERQKKLQEQLGHKSFDTTTRYWKFAPEEVGQAYDEVWEEK